MMKKALLFIIIVILLGANSVLASECARIGSKIASQRRGVLVRSTPVIQNGRNVCVVVVIVPAHDGEKLRRVEISVPVY
ncbi:hypothetical protein [Bartonella sp. CB175]|uniref:hypothetical protein n=1 Tax=Bartonella sp. CB175 TaxID=3112256 RepID=UPI00300DDF51